MTPPVKAQPADLVGRVRALILSREYKERDTIDPEEVAKELQHRHGVPVKPRSVRTAFEALADEGFLRIRPKLGTTVRVPSQNEAMNIAALRLTLEAFVGFRLALMPDKEKRIESIRVHQNTLEELLDEQDPETRNGLYIEADALFHQQIFREAGYPEGIPILNGIRRRLAMAIARDLATRERVRCVLDEHKAILQAIRAVTVNELPRASEEQNSSSKINRLLDRARIEKAFYNHFTNSVQRSFNEKVGLPELDR